MRARIRYLVIFISRSMFGEILAWGIFTFFAKMLVQSCTLPKGQSQPQKTGPATSVVMSTPERSMMLAIPVFGINRPWLPSLVSVAMPPMGHIIWKIPTGRVSAPKKRIAWTKVRILLAFLVLCDREDDVLIIASLCADAADVEDS